MALDNDDIQIHYTMDNSLGGFQMNSALGAKSIGPLGMGGETFLSDTSGYVAGILGNAVVLSLDGPVTAYDPDVAAWLTPNEEKGNIIDIELDAEDLEPDMRPFENKTISMWIMKTAERDPSLNHPGNDGTEYFLGSYWTYSTYIALRPNVDDPNGPSQLNFRAGATSSTAGGGGRTDYMVQDINMNEWYHVAMVLSNTDGETGYNGKAAFYVNGELLGYDYGVCRSSDAFRYGGLTPWRLAALGAYQCDELMSTGHVQGGLIDDFAILDGVAPGADIKFIYDLGMQGLDVSHIPEPATIALLGLGGLALLRRKR
jgi:hypothetical protein